MEKVSVVGLGKLGACYSAFYAEKGYFVTGTDKDLKKVSLFKKGLAPVSEPDLQETITKNKKRISAVFTTKEAVLESTVTFVIVPTPSQKNGSFSLVPTIEAMKEVGSALKKKKGYHLIVLVSTVLPEDSRTAIIPAIEKASGKKCGPDFGYCYSPSLIALGEILKNLRNPDFLFIGEFDKRSGDMTEKIYKKVYPNSSYERMSIESAELAKISLNSYVTMKITFANVLGDICDALPYADVDEVTNAIGKDGRIGLRYLKSGLGYGGPCFPRDNFAFSHMAEKRNVKAPHAIHTHLQNEEMPERLLKKIRELVGKRKINVGIIGTSYKPNTSVIEESPSIKIVDALIGYGHKATVFDLLGHDETKKVFKDKIEYAESMKKLIDNSHLIMISHLDQRLKELLAEYVKEVLDEKIIVDPWGMFKSGDFKQNIKYVAPGRKR